MQIQAFFKQNRPSLTALPEREKTNNLFEFNSKPSIFNSCDNK